jgi:hypothetical protein
VEDTATTQQRLRDLPSRVGIYLLLAMGLFEGAGLATVWTKLVAGLAGLPVAAPSEKALRDLRRRVGPAPVKALFEVLAGPLAQPGTRGVRYRRWRTVSFDGCCSLKVPDHERNRGWLGKIKYRLGMAGYPMLMLMALVETGTRGLVGAVFAPHRHRRARLRHQAAAPARPGHAAAGRPRLRQQRFPEGCGRHRRAVSGPRQILPPIAGPAGAARRLVPDPHRGADPTRDRGADHRDRRGRQPRMRRLPAADHTDQPPHRPGGGAGPALP